MTIAKSRRAFLETAGFTAATVGAGGWLSNAYAAELDSTPDLVVINAKVTTMDPKQPLAQAFAIKGDRFTAVGSTTDIKSLAGPKTKIYDAKGGFITPGFTDTHNHGFGEEVLFGVNAGNPFVAEFVTIQSIIDKLKARAAKTPPGTWVEASFYDDTKIKDGRPLSRTDLDKASTQHPIRVNLRGGHAAMYNSKAFELGGITKATPDIYGGTYEKDARGELSGRVTDNADRALRKLGKHETFAPAEKARRKLAGFEYITKTWAQYGITNVCYDAATEEVAGDPTGPSLLDVFQTARQRGNLMTRINFEPGEIILDAMIKTGIKTGFGDEWVRFGGTWERVQDGGLSSRTMSMTRPYIGVTPPYKGNLTEPQDSLNAWTERMYRAGIRLNTHCNGEPAIDRTLIAYERLLKMYPRPNTRPKFTHCSLPSAEQLRRIKAMDGQPSDFSTYIYYNADKFKYYGADFAEHMMPYKSFFDLGINVTTGSDFPPGPFDPRMAIQGMITRKGFNGETWGPSQKVTVDQAIRASSSNGAYHTFEEGIKGSITAGKLADYVLFADDLHTMDPEKIKDAKIVQTVVGGATKYQA
jgi:predicted amidohydrolase YtcJ